MVEVVRTREFIPNDIIEPSLSEREQKINARIDELRIKKESFDPETEFVGIRRLGSKYTVAEPFAFFEGPTEYQTRFDRWIFMGVAALFTVGGVAAMSVTGGVPYFIGLSRGFICTLPAGYLANKCYDWKMEHGKYKHNVFFSYALLHEKDFPVIERKKFDDIILDFQPRRSLNFPKVWRW